MTEPRAGRARARVLVLHLGGDPGRSRTTAAVAAALQRAGHRVAVLLSTPENAREALAELREAGVWGDPVVDFSGWDTVSQVTETWPLVRRLQVDRVVVVTDAFHLPRALRIARGAYLGRGIDVLGAPHLGGDLDRREPWRRVWLDAARALVWRCTGWLWYERAIRARRWPTIAAWARAWEEA